MSTLMRGDPSEGNIDERHSGKADIYHHYTWFRLEHQTRPLDGTDPSVARSGKNGEARNIYI